MHLLRVTIKDVRAVEDLSLDLALAPGKPRRRAVLLGVNGAGKTTLLDSIVHAFQHLAWSLGMNGATLGAADVRNVEDPEIGSASAEGPRRGAVQLRSTFSEQEQPTSFLALAMPAEMDLSFPIGEAFDPEIAGDPDLAALFSDPGPWGASSLGPAITFDGSSSDPSVADHLGHQEGAAAILLRQRPPCLFLPADRGVLEDRDDLPVKALKAFDPRIDCLSRSRERFAALAARLALATVDPRHEGHRAVSRMWKAVEKYFPEMPALVSAEGLQLRFRNKRGGLVPLRALSDGERAVLLLLGEVALRPPSSGVLLIDELEQHLHPRWQRAILQALNALVPTAQLIVTTQSPYLAASAPDDVIKIGEWDRDGE